jgi:hypothetical protein
MSIRSAGVVTILLLLNGMAFSAQKPMSQTPNNSSQSTGSGALGSAWADAGKMPDLFSGMWMTISPMIESDAKLNVPFTAKAQRYVDDYKYKRDIPYAQDGCRSPGLPIGMRSGPAKFTYAPGLISIYMQGVGHTRFIRMNQPMGKTSPKYYGNSVGHWEGDTLVVETTDFLPEVTFQYGSGKGLPPLDREGNTPGGALTALATSLNLPVAPGDPLDISKGIWGPHGEGMHMVERMRLVEPNTMELKLTIYDDTVWTTPYVAATRNYRRVQKGISEFGPFSGEPEEWVCTVSVTSFDPDTNTYKDKDPEEMVKYLDNLGR